MSETNKTVVQDRAPYYERRLLVTVSLVNDDELRAAEKRSVASIAFDESERGSFAEGVSGVLKCIRYIAPESWLMTGPGFDTEDVKHRLLDLHDGRCSSVDSLRTAQEEGHLR